MQRQFDRSTSPSRRGTALVLISITALLLSFAGLGALAVSNSSPHVLDSIAARGGNLLGRKLLEEGKTDEAKRVFTEDLKGNPNSVEAIRGLIQCAIENGDDEEAIGLFRRLTGLAPKDRAAWRKLALCASRLGRDMEALAAAQTALSLSPDGDRVMTELMTRLLTSKDSLANGALEDPFGDIGPTGRIRSKMPADPLDRMPRPKIPDPSQALPRPGRGE